MGVITEIVRVRSCALALVAFIVPSGTWLAGQSTAARPPAAAADSALSTEQRAAVEAQVNATMKRAGIPGLTVAIGRRGRLVYQRGFGFADLENRVAATELTVYRLASISKPITAVATMHLVEKGKLDLDREVQDYLADFPRKRWPLTTRHLLSHLGGVRHYRGGEVGSTKHYDTVRAGLAIFAADPLLHEPGTRFRYTTYGFNLAGAVAASAAGTRFDELLHKSVFEPAGMTATGVDDAARIIPHRAQGYARTRLGALRNARMVDTSNKLPGGGLCGTAGDLVRFGQALLDDKLVHPKTRTAMWTRAKTKDGKPVGYGLGFSILSAEPWLVGHSGGQPRVSTMLLIRPDDGVVVAVMCNLEGAPARRLARKISDGIPR
ncbi:MAG: beta-lactamase family protein [Planctomycetes bacterium]|nr:beta-lactamase family protein [Planctomycetota bacterium]